MDNEMMVLELNNETIESMIYAIRGQKVMLDFELAKIYGYETNAFNQQVTRNIKKFPERYRFQLNKNELDLVKSQFVTSRKNFYAFKQMKDYIIESKGLILNTNSYIESKFSLYEITKN